MALTTLRKWFHATTQRIHRPQLYKWMDLVTQAIDDAGLADAVFDTVATNLPAGATQAKDMSAAECAELEDGAQVYIRSTKSLWTVRTLSTLASDDITACRPTAAPLTFRLVRNLPAIEDWRAQTTWELDEISGNDEFDGSLQTQTANTLQGPIKTINEFIRRVAGKNGVIDLKGATTFTINGDYTGNVLLIWGGDWAAKLVVQGRLPATPAFTGTISAKTDLAAGSALTAATSTWTPATELGRLVHDVTNDRWTWGVKDLTGSSMRLTPWAAINLTDSSSNGAVSIGNTTVGADVTTNVLPKLTGAVRIVALQGETIGGATANPPNLIFNNFEISPAGGGSATRPVFTCNGAHVAFQNCKFSTLPPNIAGSRYEFANCLWNGVSGGGFGNLGYAYAQISAGGGLTATMPTERGSHITFVLQPLWQASPWTAAGLSRLRFTDQTAWADTANPMTITSGSIPEIRSAIWGTGNTGVGVVLARACDMRVLTGVTPTLTGNVANVDFSVGGNNTAQAFDTATGLYIATGRNCSWANLLATVATTGFGGSIFDPASGCRVAVSAN